MEFNVTGVGARVDRTGRKITLTVVGDGHARETLHMTPDMVSAVIAALAVELDTAKRITRGTYSIPVEPEGADIKATSASAYGDPRDGGSIRLAFDEDGPEGVSVVLPIPLAADLVSDMGCEIRAVVAELDSAKRIAVEQFDPRSGLRTGVLTGASRVTHYRNASSTSTVCGKPVGTGWLDRGNTQPTCSKCKAV